MKRIGRFFRGLCIAVVVLALFAAGALFVLYHGELRTLASIERVSDAPFFTMEYHADYGLDEFMQTGASSDGELKDFIVRRLLKGIPMDFELPELGCSTFAAKLSDGSSVFGRNFDELACPSMMVITRPENGYDSISMVNLSYIGFSEDSLPDDLPGGVFALAAPYVPLDGVNEKGLSAGMLFIESQPAHQVTDKTDITTTSAVRMMLDCCATVEEAVAMLEQYDMHASAGANFHFHIADAQGGSVIVEYVDNEMRVVSGNMATNFLLSPSSTYVRSIGYDRYRKMEDALVENGGVFEDMRDAMGLLEAVSQKGGPKEQSGTRWSCIYNQTDPALLLSVNRDYENLYTFSLED